MVFRQLVFYSLLVGLIAGAVVTFAQTMDVIPIIQGAEEFEGAEPEPQATEKSGGDHSDHDHSGHHHHGSDGDEWAPEDGWERTTFTFIANAIVAMGFGLLLMSAMMASQKYSPLKLNTEAWWYGLVWGLGGFVITWAVPAIGMAPEIPLQAAADLGTRQLWWILTVVCTGAGLGVLIFSGAMWRWLVGPVLLAIPWLVGAPPHPEGPMFPDQPAEAAAALEALAAKFAGATAIANAVLWIVIGWLSAWSVRRVLPSKEKPA